MGKIVSNFFISLDGVVESPDKWHFPYFDDEMGAGLEGVDPAADGWSARIHLDPVWPGLLPVFHTPAPAIRTSGLEAKRKSARIFSCGPDGSPAFRSQLPS